MSADDMTVYSSTAAECRALCYCGTQWLPMSVFPACWAHSSKPAAVQHSATAVNRWDRQCTVTYILTHTMQALSIIHKTAHLASGRHTAACNTLDDSVGAAIIRVVASINNTLRHDTMLQRRLYTFYCWRLAQVRRHFCKTCK